MTKLSQFPQETSVSLLDYFLKVKAGGAGETLQKINDIVGSYPKGYSVHFGTGNGGVNPADSTTYFFGAGSYIVLGLATNLNGAGRFFIPKAGTITAIYGVLIVTGTLASGELSTVQLQVNSGTIYNAATVAATTQQNVFSSSSINGGAGIPVVAGDYFFGLLACPAWVTNPTNVSLQCSVYISI